MTTEYSTLHLNVGEIILTSDPVKVGTTLGSCVSVCLFSKDRKFGGMVHFALPESKGYTRPEDGFRYADIAIPRLILELEKLSGQNATQFSAKIVGGGQDPQSRVQEIQVAAKNIGAARTILARYGISIDGESVGGEFSRKVFFYIPSGRLQVARINNHPPKATMAKVDKNRKRKVLIVDDSKTIRDLLSRIINGDTDLEVIGTASDALEADRMLHTLNPDVITLDIHMPIMTGVEWLEKLLSKRSIPVVMISSMQLQDGNEVFRALELGAVDYIQKPTFSELAELRPIICEKIKEASFAKVIKHNRIVRSSARSSIDTSTILAIGASTGGTEALKNVLCSLPDKIPPTLIVQHIPPVFSKAFADRINRLCDFEVKEAEDGDELRPSRVLIAPGGRHMKVESNGHGHCVRLTDDDPVNRHRPSVDYLFHSVASLFGKRAIGVILTGMGNDGAKGLLAMREAGSFTVGQNEQTSVVYGMPRVAYEVGGVEVVAALDDIAGIIISQLSGKKVA